MIFSGDSKIFLLVFAFAVVRKKETTKQLGNKCFIIEDNMLFLEHENLVRELLLLFFIFAAKPPHSEQSWLIHSSSPQPEKMILPAAQEHLGMFSTNVITAWGSGELFKEPLLSSLSSIPDDVMALCGVAQTLQINCHSWPFLSEFFFLFPLCLILFFPSRSSFHSKVHNWGFLYGLIKQPPPSSHCSLCF